LKSSTVQTLWERRDRLNIMAEIMEAAKGSQLKTRIMYMVNLSFSQVNEYLSFLTERGFLRVRLEDGKKLYETTAKGNIYFEKYMEMSNLLRTQEHAKAKILSR
jgi:predicted transcriptional regulator